MKLETEARIAKFFRKNRFLDKFNGMTIPFDPEVDIQVNSSRQKFFELSNECVTWQSYSRGLIRDKYQRPTRFMKLCKDEQVRRDYETDPINDLDPDKNYLIILTNRIDDVLNISTNRSWTSCLDRNKPQRKTFVDNPNDTTYAHSRRDEFLLGLIERNYLVAYLIEEDDLKIEKPLARLVIDDEFLYYRHHKIYGRIFNDNGIANQMLSLLKNFLLRKGYGNFKFARSFWYDITY